MNNKLNLFCKNRECKTNCKDKIILDIEYIRKNAGRRMTKDKWDSINGITQ